MLVQAGFESILRRPRGVPVGREFVEAILAGRISSGDFVRALTQSQEFRDKWVSPDAQDKKPSPPSTASEKPVLIDREQALSSC